MNQLIIKLTGEIQSSNFAEWKNDLIVQIQSVNTTLSTDDDFVAASTYVNLFKTAEKALKEAKQSALEQSYDIQRLFSAIDEISEQARQTRLSLERQINIRKLEIKEGCLQSGIEVIRSFINSQTTDFQLINHQTYLDRKRFELAIKGKASITGIQSAINALCRDIKLEIYQKIDEIKNNVATIETLPSTYKLLFQDRNSLIALNQQELSLTIEKRLALFHAETTKINAEKAIDTLNQLEDISLNVNCEIAEKQKYKIIIDIFSSKESAIELARAIKTAYSDNSLISNIKLNRSFD